MSEIYIITTPIDDEISITHIFANSDPKKLKDYIAQEHDMWLNYTTGSFFVFMKGKWRVR